MTRFAGRVFGATVLTEAHASKLTILILVYDSWHKLIAGRELAAKKAKRGGSGDHLRELLTIGKGYRNTQQ